MIDAKLLFKRKAKGIWIKKRIVHNKMQHAAFFWASKYIENFSSLPK